MLKRGSSLKSTARDLSRKLEEEEEDAEASRKKSFLESVGYTLVRFLGASALFLVLLFGAAYVLWIYEAPIEAGARVADHAERDRWRSIIARLFRFIAVPSADGLSGTTCSAAYDNVAGVFPDYDLPTPPERWVLASDNVTTCDVGTSASGTCVLTCVLKHPTFKQVERCRVVDADGYNPALFDATCLASTSACPNCHLLTVGLGELTFMGPAGEDPSGKRKIQLAEIYATYRSRLESIAPTTHWDARGSIFFAFTVLTAVGYGNYAPTAWQSKLAITATAIPGIVVFAYALSLFAGTVMRTVTYLKVKFEFARARPRVTRRARIWANTLRQCDVDGNGELSLEELVKGADAICKIIGIDVGGDAGGTGDGKKGVQSGDDDTADENSNHDADDDDDNVKTYHAPGSLGYQIATAKKRGPSNPISAHAQTEARDFIKRAFADADVHGKGSLTLMESMAMVSDLVRVRETQLVESQSWENLKASVFCFLPLVAVAALGFKRLERNAGNDSYTHLDCFYFVIVSLTTVGLGDITPSRGYSLGFWYVWMTMGLGLIALIFANAGAILANASARYELMAFKNANALRKPSGKSGKSLEKPKMPSLKSRETGLRTKKPEVSFAKKQTLEKSRSASSKVAPSPSPAPRRLEMDVDVEKAFGNRENSKWGTKR